MPNLHFRRWQISKGRIISPAAQTLDTEIQTWSSIRSISRLATSLKLVAVSGPTDSNKGKVGAICISSSFWSFECSPPGLGACNTKASNARERTSVVIGNWQKSLEGHLRPFEERKQMVEVEVCVFCKDNFAHNFQKCLGRRLNLKFELRSSRGWPICVLFDVDVDKPEIPMCWDQNRSPELNTVRSTTSLRMRYWATARTRSFCAIHEKMLEMACASTNNSPIFREQF